MEQDNAERWDVFCRVVDNFGDVGVSWRLARSLAREHGKRVRLWLDDVATLAALRPEVDATRETQTLEGVEIARMREAFAPADVADVVVETFGCDPPEAYVLAMVGREPRARWINLEYLSAEEWVEGSHARPSPNPRLPLTKHYFFPGFTPRTGGLLREADLLRRRDAFQEEPGTQAKFWTALVGRVPPGGALKVSLFSYPGAPVAELLDACARHPLPVWLVAPVSRDSAPIEEWLAAREGGECGRLEVFGVPFLSQDAYDELLWACDVNFVRGEDSFVRAQWAAKPFVWHIYPQEENAHWVKLAAFLARYTAGLDREQAAVVTGLWEAWNRGEPLTRAWPEFLEQQLALQRHARDWAEELARQSDLATTLVDFAGNVLE